MEVYTKLFTLSFIDNKPSLIPVDASDYNNDGTSEWIFMYTNYDSDGYFLFDTLSKKTIPTTTKVHF